MFVSPQRLNQSIAHPFKRKNRPTQAQRPRLGKLFSALPDTAKDRALP